MAKNASWLNRLRTQWETSLRFRLMALGLAPLLVAFPIVIAVLVLFGGERANTLMYANVQSSLASANNYLSQIKSSTTRSVSQTTRSERLARLLRDKAKRAELDELLRTTAQGTGLDYLVIIDSQQKIIASSTGSGTGIFLPGSHVIRQAQSGIATAAFERFEADQLATVSPNFRSEARVMLADNSEHVETRGLVLNSAAHFPLMANELDAILVGGTMINQNYPLIEHLREILFPVGILPGNIEGMAVISLDDIAISISRQRHLGDRQMGIRLPPDVATSVLQTGLPWVGRNVFSGSNFTMGYEPLIDSEERRIGILGVGFPNSPYVQSALLILGIVSIVLALVMMAISVVFLRAGRQLSTRLGLISSTMNRVAAGERSARTPVIGQDDEVGQLMRHFNALLDSNEREEATRRTAEAELDAYRRHLEQLVSMRTVELNTRNEQLDAIFALSLDGFVSFDMERKVSFVNGAFLRMTNLVERDVIGLDQSEFSKRMASISEPSAVFPGIAFLRSGRKHSELESQPATGATGSRRHVFELSRPSRRVLEINLRVGEMEGVSQVLYCRDVTHETEVDRMKSEFLSHAAHELRTPMASILGYAELLLAMDFTEAERHEFLSVIHRQAELLVSIINELLDLARIEARQGKDFVHEQLDLHELLNEVIAGWKVPDGRNAPAIIGNSGIWLQADRKKLMQALGNLVSNAYKYSPMGGEVNIELALYPAENDVPGRIFITVSDHGIGMTPEQQARVCERFYRADSSGKIPGSGLGMSIVKEIIELHGGGIEIASEIGKGTQVKLWLPIAK
jgi:signal transduction histidine kinase/HAMP domain-containing protein